MTFLEALKSGRKFTRVGYGSWFTVVRHEIVNCLDGSKAHLGSDELLAEDWIIQHTQELTLEQILHAIDEASAESESDVDFENNLAYFLGFKSER